MPKDSNQNPFTDTRRVENFLEKPLPSNVEAEQALLGMVLLDNDVMPQLAEVVLPEDMYSPMHRNVYAAMLELFAGKRPIDPILIGEELAKAGSLEVIGGVPAITNLSYGLPHISDVEEYLGENYNDRHTLVCLESLEGSHLVRYEQCGLFRSWVYVEPPVEKDKTYNNSAAMHRKPKYHFELVDRTRPAVENFPGGAA